jgi:hypothetical protein
MAEAEERKLGGGELSARVQEGEKLRSPRRAAHLHADRLMQGEAWRDFCRALERTGDFIRDADVPEGERSRAEGMRYLLGMTTLGIRQALEAGDPEYPGFTRIEDPWVKWGAENADNLYFHARIRGDRTYRIRGERGSCLLFLIEVKEGFMHMGDVRNFETLCSEDLDMEEDGSFEIIASAKEQSGNWLPLDIDATQIVIRQYFYDWANEEAARFSIECVETLGMPPEADSPERMGQVIDDISHFVEMTTKFWAEWMPKMRAEHVPGRLAPARGFVGGADDIRYGNDVYELGSDEALIIETEVPDARYWHYQLCNPYFVTMDYANRINSINGAQARIDSDGLFRCVIAHRDPGCPNWLDTGGQKSGMIQYRYVWTRDSPQPNSRRVAFSEVWNFLPEGTSKITNQERQREIQVRQRAVARRFRP